MTEFRRTWWTVAGVAALTAVAAWISFPFGPDIRIGSWQPAASLRLGLDLQGGAHLVYRANLEGVSASDAPEALAGVRDVIERRINAFGISEPVVQTNRVNDEFRVIVELAGVHDLRRAIALIGETPQLDFRREVGQDEAAAQYNIDNPDSIAGPIFERTQLTGKHLQRAAVAFDPITSEPHVQLSFNTEGSALFAELTKANLGQRIAIYLDGVPISAPIVQAEITNGQAIISGGFSLPEAKELAQRLNAGALPVPIELIGQQTVGPALGAQAIHESLLAGTVGLLAVAVWMVVFYRLPGAAAVLALLVYALLFYAILLITHVTLTLAGIAGFILSIGMAVDANVLIFERFRENLRAGKRVRFALEEGFQEAWRSIYSSNISSLLTALILYTFGTSLIRGFAFTFALGVTLSMFSAITITRTLLRLVLSLPASQRPVLLAVERIVSL
ncbi:MAG: protein translocase subunit SecD [Candidatus Andersenbacteria bacterium CG10_big_fil_rev_8_21_14_0_10_54_11]|uniref:Protein translocase subunit SecD n=1 Tax=Candidatus Andersenbacteria bacterium CG10_big_fil_rev_8_21_14_0_10_54_11 TaxID=1974485 RepID=A0A2M6WYG9_9BACT|nr:MAG: protein translocase subunit SecD [Candidatus Andersenbacteria bacterium CG10_big_fil_rev_8_21_14_0_10_54_11]